MTAAATTAGYLYASGRLRGRAARAQVQQEKKPEKPAAPPPREKIRVAVLAQEEQKPRRMPKIEYRRRRLWSVE